MWGAVPLAFLLVLVSLGRRIPSAYLTWGAGPLAGYLMIWSASSTFSGTWDPAPLPYVPLLSPIDVRYFSRSRRCSCGLRERLRSAS